VIDFDTARAIVARVGTAARLPAERVATSLAHGRILAADLRAPIDLPPFDNSAMDGIALRSGDLAPEGDTRLRVVGDQFAGLAGDWTLGAGECLRITTGAPLPAGADAIAMQESVRDNGEFVIVPQGAAVRGRFVRGAGEDVRAGDLVLAAGSLLTPARVGLASALGLDRLDVAQRPTVAVFTTGDELVEPGLPLRRGEIHDANRELLMGLLRADGLAPVAWPRLPDDPAKVATVLADAGDNFDLLVTCGGVSVGAKDHIPALMHDRGTVHFWKVAMKPGMPLLFAQLGRARVLGLPGNPVSVLATWLALGRELADAMQGRTEPRKRWYAQLTVPVPKTHERREFLRGTLQPGDDGVLRVQPDLANGSHRLASASRADALIVLPEGARDFEAGEPVEILVL
jgi:molybdopterin molybdotransferase